MYHLIWIGRHQTEVPYNMKTTTVWQRTRTATTTLFWPAGDVTTTTLVPTGSLGLPQDLRSKRLQMNRQTNLDVIDPYYTIVTPLYTMQPTPYYLRVTSLIRNTMVGIYIYPTTVTNLAIQYLPRRAAISAILINIITSTKMAVTTNCQYISHLPRYSIRTRNAVQSLAKYTKYTKYTTQQPTTDYAGVFSSPFSSSSSVNIHLHRSTCISRLSIACSLYLVTVYIEWPSTGDVRTYVHVHRSPIRCLSHPKLMWPIYKQLIRHTPPPFKLKILIFTKSRHTFYESWIRNLTLYWADILMLTG